MFRKFFIEEKGQSLVLVALMLTALIGIAGLAIDGGSMYSQKSNLQKAADSAALAGAKDLPNKSTAIDTAEKYAIKNGVKKPDEITSIDTYQDDPTKIEVVLTRKVSFTFARVLGLTDTDIPARAVAKQTFKWAGETLPFINLDDDYLANPNIEAWEKAGAGDKESIDSFLIKNFNPYSEKTYFLVDYKNGVVLKNGFANGQNGDDKNGKLKDALDSMLTPLRSVYYLISLNSETIKSLMNDGTVKLKNGVPTKLSDLKQGDIIDPSELVLLEVTINSFDGSNQHNIKMTYKAAYDVVNGEFPPDYKWADGSHNIPKLIE